MIKTADLDRLLIKADIKDAGQCWLWKAAKAGEGRIGTFWLNGSMMPAHRASFILHKGAIPDGLCVCHSCDTPLCINPSHLFTGTQKDNMDDMDSKGRRVNLVGIQNGKSVLTPENVQDIRFKLARGDRKYLVARMYNVTQQCVHDISTGRTWSHLPPPVTT